MEFSIITIPASKRTGECKLFRKTWKKTSNFFVRYDKKVQFYVIILAGGFVNAIMWWSTCNLPKIALRNPLLSSFFYFIQLDFVSDPWKRRLLQMSSLMLARTGFSWHFKKSRSLQAGGMFRHDINSFGSWSERWSRLADVESCLTPVLTLRWQCAQVYFGANHKIEKWRGESSWSWH